MKIRELQRPIIGLKSDWLPGTNWLGFSPPKDDLPSRNKRISALRRQFLRKGRPGYIIEYVTASMERPNKGSENDPILQSELKMHEQLKGRFVAVHLIRDTPARLNDIIGKEAYERIQRIWAKKGKPFRWSIAFPIIETYKIKGHPLIREVLPPDTINSLINRQSQTLRLITDDQAQYFLDLDIEGPIHPNIQHAIEAELKRDAESGLTIDDETRQNIFHDMVGVLVREGMSETALVKIKTRASHIAYKFKEARRTANTLFCDSCQWNPYGLFEHPDFNPKGLLDAHHKNPLSEGERLTSIDDFSLLCPLCHRIEHVRLALDMLQ